jgi:hypothetical protein
MENQTHLNNDIDLVLRINSYQLSTVYLSVSWQPDKGKEFGYKVIKRLDEQNILVIGDTKGFDSMDPIRLNRIMSQADSFLSILPFRPEKSCKTSIFMLDELSFAINNRLPISIIYDSRIPITIIENPSNNTTSFVFQDGKSMEIPDDLKISYSPFDFGVSKSEELLLITLTDFISNSNRTSGKIPPYSFLISRLQPDFTLPRKSCITASESSSGIPCLWIDSPQYSTNIDDTIERARLLIKHAQFIVAEISLTEENPDYDNPSRAHEIGLATAYRKKIFYVSHGPRRHPYHGIVSTQFIWWDDENQLCKDLSTSIYTERDKLGRHIYNRELENLNDGFTSKFGTPIFDPSTYKKWNSPISDESGRTQSWIYAISFGLIVACTSILLKKFVNYDQTLDLVAIFAGIITIFFSSRISKKIQQTLHQTNYLRWLIPLLAILLFFSIFFTSTYQRNEPSTPSQNNTTNE